MSRLEIYIIGDLTDEERSAIWHDVARVLLFLETLAKTGRWKRRLRRTLHSIQRLCEDLLRRVATVGAKTLGWPEVWER